LDYSEDAGRTLLLHRELGTKKKPFITENWDLQQQFLPLTYAELQKIKTFFELKILILYLFDSASLI
jgi:hypothetical protein